MHRWVWDLRYPAPRAPHYEYPISAVPHDTPRTPQGPLALPGSYTVRLTAGGHSYTAPLVVKMDPRVTTQVAGLQQQFDLQHHLASLLTASTEAVGQVHSVREQIKTILLQASGATKDSLQQFDDKIKLVLAGPEKPASGKKEPALSSVNGATNTLYAEVDRADAAPTTAQSAATTAAEHDASIVMKQWVGIKASDLPAVNAQLRSAHLPEINPEAQVDTGVGQGDED
jgi:hypothetical protein